MILEVYSSESAFVILQNNFNCIELKIAGKRAEQTKENTSACFNKWIIVITYILYSCFAIVDKIKKKV